MTSSTASALGSVLSGALSDSATTKGANVADLTITHNYNDGTLLTGSSRGDGVLDLLRAPELRRCGWRWMPSIRSIGIHASRFHTAKLWAIDATAAALRAAGHTVTLELDTSAGDRGEALEVLAENDQRRAERLEERAAGAHEEAQQRWDAFEQIADMIPTGQPILVGHHSERRHRRDIEKMQTNLRKAAETWSYARELERRAGAVRDLERLMRRPGYLDRKIAEATKTIKQATERLERGVMGWCYRCTECRAVMNAEGFAETRTYSHREPTTCTATTGREHYGWLPISDLARAQNAADLEQAEADRRFYAETRDRMIAEGELSNYSRATIKPGDRVRVRGRWSTVVRVNPKTVAVETGYSWTDKIPYGEIVGHEPA